jgi:3-methyl-2-oxobutanoate hydroxymethyltransferase
VSRITTTKLRKMKQAGEKIACLTAYDAGFGKILEAAGVEIILVGDSLGMVVQGLDNTIPVTMDDMVYHTRLVSRVCNKALVMADMPFMSYVDTSQALANAGRLMKEGGAQMVKLEVATPMLDIVQAMSDYGIPVCAHLGLLPQSVHKLGGYRQQGKDELSAKEILHDALAMESAGADVLLLECVPASLAKEITEALQIPVIGIGAGPDCDSQVLVLNDVLGITTGYQPSFSKNFLLEAKDIPGAIEAYVKAVKDGSFPAPEHFS